jgi:hypothetical protein
VAKHDVAFAIPQKFVLSKDVEFNVKSNGAKLGTLLISKGNIEWVPASNTVKKYRLSWEMFADVMETAGRVRKMR